MKSRDQGHESEQTPGDNEGQESQVCCCCPWGCRVGHDLVAEQQQNQQPFFFFRSLSIPERLIFSSILTSFQSSLTCSLLSWFIFHSLPTSSITVGDTHWKTGRQDTEVNDCGFSNINVILRQTMRVWVHILASAVLSQCTWSTVNSELELSPWWLSQ